MHLANPTLLLALILYATTTTTTSAAPSPATNTKDTLALTAGQRPDPNAPLYNDSWIDPTGAPSYRCVSHIDHFNADALIQGSHWPCNTVGYHGEKLIKAIDRECHMNMFKVGWTWVAVAKDVGWERCLSATPAEDMDLAFTRLDAVRWSVEFGMGDGDDGRRCVERAIVKLSGVELRQVCEPWNGPMGWDEV